MFLTTPVIERFVADATEGRPPSHGLEHMKKVRDNALEINRQLDQPTTAYDVSLVSLLHDVADHKYDPDGQLREKTIRWLYSNHTNGDTVMKVIDAISFSKEKKLGKRWFEAETDGTGTGLSPYWVKIRDIVSDADKLEALGNVGGERCVQYAEEHGITGHDATMHLFQHMLDKLLLLKDEYIVTEPGKKMAQEKHDELVRFALNRAIGEPN